MRPRASGGFEPDDLDQTELVGLWHLSRTALADRIVGNADRITWVVDEFLKQNGTKPNVSRKWIYVWCADNLGVTTKSFSPKRVLRRGV